MIYQKLFRFLIQNTKQYCHKIHKNFQFRITNKNHTHINSNKAAIIIFFCSFYTTYFRNRIYVCLILVYVAETVKSLLSLNQKIYSISVRDRIKGAKKKKYRRNIFTHKWSLKRNDKNLTYYHKILFI